MPTVAHLPLSPNRFPPVQVVFKEVKSSCSGSNVFETQPLVKCCVDRGCCSAEKSDKKDRAYRYSIVHVEIPKMCSRQAVCKDLIRLRDSCWLADLVIKSVAQHKVKAKSKRHVLTSRPYSALSHGTGANLRFIKARTGIGMQNGR